MCRPDVYKLLVTLQPGEGDLTEEESLPIPPLQTPIRQGKTDF